MYAAADAKMTRRNGSVIKYVVCVSFVLGGVYFIYLYNDVSGKLTESERVAEKYRRSEESLSSQLQDISAGKEELRQRCEAEKKEFQNRLSSIQQQHKMLKTQNDDLQAEYSKLNMERQKEIDDQKLQESQRNQEYMQLKQEKDLEISSLKDQVANLEREKAQVSETISSLKLQLQNSQQQLQAQQQQQFQQQGQNALGQIAGNQPPQNVQGMQNVQNVQQQGQNNNPVVQGMPVNNQAGNQLNVNSNLGNILHEGAGVQNVAGQVGVQEMQQNQQGGVQNGLNEAEKAKLIDEHQQQHQVGPPMNLDNKEEDEDGEKPNENLEDHINHLLPQGAVGLKVADPNHEDEDKVPRSDDKNIKVEHHPQDSQPVKDDDNNMNNVVDADLHVPDAADDKDKDEKDDYNEDDQDYDDPNEAEKDIKPR